MVFVSLFIVSKYDAPPTFEIAPISKTPPTQFTLPSMILVRLPLAFDWFLNAVPGSHLPVMKLKPASYRWQVADSLPINTAPNQQRHARANVMAQRKWYPTISIRISTLMLKTNGALLLGNHPCKRTHLGTYVTTERLTSWVKSRFLPESLSKQHSQSLETTTSSTTNPLFP